MFCERRDHAVHRGVDLFIGQGALAVLQHHAKRYTFLFCINTLPAIYVKQLQVHEQFSRRLPRRFQHARAGTLPRPARWRYHV